MSPSRAEIPGGVQCNGCAQGIDGRLLEALGARWHPGCFRCTECSIELERVAFYEHEGLPYCAVDHDELFTRKCYSCKTAIVDEVHITLDDPSLSSDTRYYHALHLFCAECGDPFVDPRTERRVAAAAAATRAIPPVSANVVKDDTGVGSQITVSVPMIAVPDEGLEMVPTVVASAENGTQTPQILVHPDFEASQTTKARQADPPVVPASIITPADAPSITLTQDGAASDQGQQRKNDETVELDIVDGELTGRPFTLWKGYAYCETCHHRLHFPRCAGCRMPIVQGDEIRAFKKAWHGSCFRCHVRLQLYILHQACSNVLRPDAFLVADGHGFCVDCYEGRSHGA